MLCHTLRLTKHVFDVIFSRLLVGNVAKHLLLLGVNVFL